MDVNGLTCPKCNNESIIVENLLSYPMKYDCFCCRCDFELGFFNRKDCVKIITQDELNRFYNESKIIER